MITVEVDDKAFRDELARLGHRIGDLTPVMRDIGSGLLSRISDRFEGQTDPLGRSWAPWAESTIKSYPKGGNHKLLDRLGDLLDGRSHQADKNSVRVGFNVPYSTYHEYSTQKMPRRGLLFADPEAGTLAPDDEALVLDIIDQWLTKT